MTKTVEPDCQVCKDVDVRADLAEQMMASFSRMLDASRLPPVDVLAMMSEAIGDVYRQVSEAHLSGFCECGWRPDMPRDLEAMRKALAAGCLAGRRQTLHFMPTAGRA